MKAKKIDFSLEKLSIEEISFFLKLNDNDFFEKLSDRVNIYDYSQKLYENAIHFTLYDENSLVGFSPCYFDDTIQKVGYISSLTIKDGYRDFGMGSLMLRYIKEYAKNSDFKTLLVGIHSDNKISSNFYQKNDFKIFEQNFEKKKSILEYKIKQLS